MSENASVAISKAGKIVDHKCNKLTYEQLDNAYNTIIDKYMLACDKIAELQVTLANVSNNLDLREKRIRELEEGLLKLIDNEGKF